MGRQRLANINTTKAAKSAQVSLEAAGAGLVRERSVWGRGYQLWQLVLALLVLSLALAVWIFFAAQHSHMYTLSQQELNLIGKSSVDQKLIKSVDDKITYNRAEETDNQNPKILKAAAAVDATGNVPYAAELNQDHSQGLTFSDAAGELEFALVPQFESSDAKYENGRVIYPEGADRTHVYTYKDNGLKEDIILAKSPGPTVQYSWKLELGDKLEAKMRPDGSVGLFSANPLLFGNVQTSDDESKQLVEKARTNNIKDHLAFVLPAPYIRDANGQQNTQDVSFSLKDNILTLEARNLDSQAYPLSIDPSVTVTTSADFRQANDDGMIDYATANQIGRLPISTGSVGAMTQQTNMFTNPRYRHASAFYNGYMYIVGGYITGTNGVDDIIRCPINSGGDAGTCVRQTTAFTTGRGDHTVVAYNGYLYIIGGTSGAPRYNDIQYCPLDASTGAVGTCTQQSNAFSIARNGHASVVYNGFLYIIGGADSTPTSYNDIQFCPLEADGSVGTCTLQNNAFTTARQNHSAAVYNGFLYIIGGNGGGNNNDIQYCPINANGSTGTCIQQAAAFTTARQRHTTFIYNGYLYIAGGFDGTTYYNDIQYCPILANGSVGTCTQQAAAFTSIRGDHTSFAYNGYMYIVAGSDGTTDQNDIQRLLISTGTPSGFGAVGTTTQQTSAFTNARYGHTSVVYNEYLYIIGGYDGTTYYNDIFRCPISQAGTVGTCVQQTTAFTSARHSHTSVVYNGFLYIIGGTTGTAQDDVQYCPISQATGAVGTCTQQTSAFTTARSEHTSIAYKGYLYIIGGNGGGAQNDISYCAINANGSINACTQQTSAFTTARYGHTSVAYNGYLYITGGWNGTTYYNDNQYCAINGNGSIAACTSQAAAFTTARYGHTMVAYNGYMYIIGGTTPTNQNDIQYCAINSNGSLAACTVQAAAFTTIRHSHTSIAADGFVYIVGGTGASNQNDIQYLRPNRHALIGRYEKTFDIGRIAYSVNNIQYNGTVACGANIAYSTAAADGVFGNQTTFLAAQAATTYTIGENSKRYVKLVVTLDDSTCGGTSVMTDIAVSYTLKASTPTLYTPAADALSQISLPVFTLKAPDPENDYLRYKIEVCSNSDCSSILRTIDQTSSQTGWSGQNQQTSTAYTGNVVLASSTTATHTYQAAGLAASTQYWWRGYAIDPGDTNTWSDASAIQTFVTTGPAATPTIVAPSAAATGVNPEAEFLLRTTDPDTDYVRYKIEVCSVSDCSVILRTIDQTSSQTGWSSQNASSGTAYTTSGFIVGNSQLAIHTYLTPFLAGNTQYWWRAYAIDPAGSNTWSSATAITTFTTGVNLVRILGGTTILGGTKIGN